MEILQKAGKGYFKEQIVRAGEADRQVKRKDEVS